jgi:uncharacterized membrane protein
VLFVAFVVAGVLSTDFFWLAEWRMARRLRWKWEKAARQDLKSVPRLRRIRVHGGVADALIITRSGNWDAIRSALDLDSGEMLAKLRLNRRMGSPFRATIIASGHRNPARTQSLRLYYVPLGLPDTFPPYEKPADGAKLFVGHTVDGPLMVDLEEAPHVQIVGDTGTGKGQEISVFEGQVLRAGWLLVVIDGGASPEYAVLDPAPTVLRPMRIEQTKEERLQAAITAVALINAMGEARSAISEAFGVGRPADLPADVLAWLPRIGIVVDETTKLLSPSKSAKNKALNELRAELAAVLDTDVLRNGRKFRTHVLPLADQFAYSVVFSRGTQRQASHVIVLGNLGSDQVRQVTGLPELPPVPEVPRCGHYVRFGNPRIHEKRMPFHPDSCRGRRGCPSPRCAPSGWPSSP